MANETEKKKCKGCGVPKPTKDFVKSKVAKSGRLGYCYECWSGMVSHKKGGPKKHKVKTKPGRKPSRKPGLNGHDKVVVQAANDALKVAGTRKERFLVKAGDDNEVAEFANEDKALRHAMEQRMKGLPVSVWRSCEFEMVLRIIG